MIERLLVLTLSTMARQEQHTVFISKEKEVVILPRDNEEVTVMNRKESNTSFLNPAINLARRLSMKITGQRGRKMIGLCAVIWVNTIFI